MMKVIGVRAWAIVVGFALFVINLVGLGYYLSPEPPPPPPRGCYESTMVLGPKYQGPINCEVGTELEVTAVGPADSPVPYHLVKCLCPPKPPAKDVEVRVDFR